MKMADDFVKKVYVWLVEKYNQELGETKQDTFDKEFLLKKMGKAFLDLTPVKMDGNFDQQVEDVFRLVDINQNGSINKQELKLGCKKLGLNLNDEEVAQLFDSFKGNDGSQNLSKQEFADLIGYKFRNDLVKPATVIDRLRTEIQAIDIDGSGTLNGDQIMNLYSRMGVEITESEVSDLIEEIGDPEKS